MFAGMAGTISLGLFGAAKYGLSGPTGADATSTIDGLFYGGGGHLLWTQTYGTFAVMGATLAASLVLMYSVKAIGALRIPEAGEREGLDLHEHGAAAYPEFVLNRGIGGYAQPIPVEAAVSAPAPRVVQPHLSTTGRAV
jgi:Amt family ammonium transporter